MKPIDNRQNKLINTKAQEQKTGGRGAGPLPVSLPGDASQVGISHGGAVFGLLSNLLIATKIAQSAKHLHLGVHNFDKAGPLLEHARQKPPILVILDWDGREAESFKLLKEFAKDAELKKVAVVGFLTNSHQPLKEEAERAGCHRVYPKTEFTKHLDDLLMRYAQ